MATTFGTTGVGGTPRECASAYIVANKYTLTESGTVTKLSAYLYKKYAPDAFKMAIYSDASPMVKLCEGTGVMPVTAGWADCTISSGGELTAGDYWITLMGDCDWYLYYNAAALHAFAETNTYANGFPANIAAWDYDDGAVTYSIYATYTPGGGGDVSLPLTGVCG